MFHQETSEVTNDFNHPSEDSVNCVSTDLSTQMISTQNDGQSSGIQSRGSTQIQFLLGEEILDALIAETNLLKEKVLSKGHLGSYP